jgi:hypothetical protein
MEPMMDGFRFPRFDREVFMAFGQGRFTRDAITGVSEVSIISERLSYVNRQTSGPADLIFNKLTSGF